MATTAGVSGWVDSAGCFRWTHLEHPAVHLGLVILDARLCLEDLENQRTHDTDGFYTFKSVSPLTLA